MNVLFLFPQNDKQLRLEVKKMHGTRFSEEKPKDCRYCYFWCGKKKCCSLGKAECYYKVIEEEVKKNECSDCPYGKHSPCIGWCMKKLLSSNGGSHGV